MSAAIINTVKAAFPALADRVKEPKVLVEGKLYKFLLSAGKAGTESKNGDSIEVHYTGNFENGKTFDSSYNRNRPLPMKVGVGMVIQGWDQGLLNSTVGEESIIWIHYDYAYGPNGMPPVIPPKSNLVFHCNRVK